MLKSERMPGPKSARNTSMIRDLTHIPTRKMGVVMVYMPAEDRGKRRKLALPYHGPYRILEVRPNTLLVQPVDHVDLKPILVSMDQVMRCSDELSPGLDLVGRKGRRQSLQKRRARRGTRWYLPTH